MLKKQIHSFFNISLEVKTHNFFFNVHYIINITLTTSLDLEMIFEFNL